jgi:hypothetical protein
MANASQAELDFSAYRKPELFERIGALISVPRTLATIAMCGLAALPIIWIVLPLGFGDRIGWQWYLGLYAYGTIASIGLGILTGMAFALNRGLANLVQILDMSLEISQQATRDMAAVRDGTTKPPTLQQVISGVYEQVILATLEGVIRSQSKWLAGIVLPVYRWTLGRLATRLLKRFAATEEESPDEVTIAEPAEAVESEAVDLPEEGNETESDESVEGSGVVAKMEASTEHAIRWLTHARSYASGLGDGFRCLVMVPITVLLVLAGLVSVVPIAVVWWLG